jgi:RND family efflux transporter MFP subunit
MNRQAHTIYPETSHPARDGARTETLRSLFQEPLSPIQEPPARKRRRLLYPLLLAAFFGAAALGASVVWPTSAPDKAPAPALQNPVAVPPPAIAVREITGSGFVMAPQKTAVFSKYEGQVVRVAVAAGDVVETGQVFVVLNDASARFSLDQAIADRQKAELQAQASDIDLAQAAASLARTKTLALRDAATRQALEEQDTAMRKAVNAVAQARQSVDSADLAVRIAKEKVDALTVRAPFAGTVTRLEAHVGDSVLARADSVRESQSLLTLSDTTQLVIDADIAESQIAMLRAGLAGEAVLDGFPDHAFAVTVTRLAPAASAEKGTISLRLSLRDPPEGIRPNMAARIRLFLDPTGDRLP